MCTGEAPGAASTLLEAVRSGQVEPHAACSLRRLARANSLRVALPGPVEGYTSVSSDLLAVGPQAFKLHTLAHSCVGWVLATAQPAVLRCCEGLRDLDSIHRSPASVFLCLPILAGSAPPAVGTLLVEFASEACITPTDLRACVLLASELSLRHSQSLGRLAASVAAALAPPPARPTPVPGSWGSVPLGPAASSEDGSSSDSSNPDAQGRGSGNRTSRRRRRRRKQAERSGAADGCEQCESLPRQQQHRHCQHQQIWWQPQLRLHTRGPGGAGGAGPAPRPAGGLSKLALQLGLPREEAAYCAWRQQQLVEGDGVRLSGLLLWHLAALLAAWYCRSSTPAAALPLLLPTALLALLLALRAATAGGGWYAAGRSWLVAGLCVGLALERALWAPRLLRTLGWGWAERTLSLAPLCTLAYGVVLEVPFPWHLGVLLADWGVWILALQQSCLAGQAVEGLRSCLAAGAAKAAVCELLLPAAAAYLGELQRRRVWLAAAMADLHED